MNKIDFEDVEAEMQTLSPTTIGQGDGTGKTKQNIENIGSTENNLDTDTNVSISNEPRGSTRAPLWAWGALIVAVIACSSGGVWFILLSDTPAVLRASWRLMLTSFMQLPGFIRDFYRADEDMRTAFFRSFTRLIIAGVALAIHFCAWSLSLNMTSLSHSLLFVCTTPILLVGFQTMTFICLSKFSDRFKSPPTLLEVLGSLVGFGAACILANEAAANSTVDPNSLQHEPTLLGDLVATLGAAAMGVYLLTGASLRSWMPVWLYVFPVTIIAGLLAALFSIAFEEKTQLAGVSAQSLFGLFGSGQRFGLVLGSAFTAGILGHTMANLALEYISPLIVSVLLLFEPLIGSFIGYIVGVQGPPSLVTWLAGFPLMIAAGLVSLGGRDSDLDKWCRRKCVGVKSMIAKVEHEPLSDTREDG